MSENNVNSTEEIVLSVEMGDAVSAQTAEAYAVGKRGGVDVAETDPTWHNNAKYYAEQAEEAAGEAQGAEEAAQRAETAQAAAEAARDRAEAIGAGAAQSAAAAAESAQAAATAKTGAETAQSAAAGSATAAEGSAGRASQSATAAAGSATAAGTAKTAAETARDAAAGSATAAAGSATAADQSAQAAAASAQAAEDVAESIPADYSQLSDDVSGLKSALTTFTGNSVLTIIKGYYITTNDTTYDLTSPVQNGGYCYAVVDVSPGDKFTITGKGGSAPRLWAFGDAVGNILDPRADANKTETDFVLVAPSNATKLILNSYQNVNPVFYAGDLVVNRLDATDQKIDNVEAALNTKIDSINSEFDTITTTTPNINDEVYEYGRFNVAGAEYQDSQASSAFRTKNYIRVIGGKTVKYYGQYEGDRSNYISYAMQIVQYNSSKEVIVGRTDIYQETSGASPQSLTLNDNTAYIRFSIYKADQEFSKVQVCLYYDDLYFPWYIPHETVIDTSSEYDPLFYGKLIAYNGDSICQNSGGYGAIIQRQKYTRYYNNAVGGAHLAHWEGTPTRHIVCESVSEMPNDADLICFEGGINDYWGNALIGELTSGYTDTLDTSTICGAMESIFRQAIEKWTGKPICFIIVHKIYHTSDQANATGKTFKDYHDAMIAVCQKYSIPYIDMFYGSGMNCEIETIARNFTLPNSGYPWGVDGCHPNTAGYTDYYVPKLIEFFRSLLIK